MRANLSRQRLVALSLAGIPLLTYPILGLPGGAVAGIPVLFLYLFGVWLGLIIFAAVVLERHGA